MIRVVAVAVLLVLFCFGAAALVRLLSQRHVDWRGVAIAVGFVLLAFWLQHVTGAGQLFG